MNIKQRLCQQIRGVSCYSINSFETVVVNKLFAEMLPQHFNLGKKMKYIFVVAFIQTNWIHSVLISV